MHKETEPRRNVLRIQGARTRAMRLRQARARRASHADGQCPGPVALRPCAEIKEDAVFDQRGLDKIGVAFTIVTIIVAAIAVAMVRSSLGERVTLVSDLIAHSIQSGERLDYDPTADRAGASSGGVASMESASMRKRTNLSQLRQSVLKHSDVSMSSAADKAAGQARHA